MMSYHYRGGSRIGLWGKCAPFSSETYQIVLFIHIGDEKGLGLLEHPNFKKGWSPFQISFE